MAEATLTIASKKGCFYSEAAGTWGVLTQPAYSTQRDTLQILPLAHKEREGELDPSVGKHAELSLRSDTPRPFPFSRSKWDFDILLEESDGKRRTHVSQAHKIQ